MQKIDKGLWIFIILVIALIGGFIAWQLTDNQDKAGSSETVQPEENSEVEGTEDESGDVEEGGTVTEFAYPTSDWATHGGDLYNRRYSLLDQINVSNIGDLSPVWTASLGSGLEFKYSGEATPIVVDGIMYVSTGANDVLALDAVTGEQLWEYRPDIPEEMDTVCCGWTNRGVAVGDGRVYVTLLDARLVALDIKTGEVLWENEVARWEEGYTMTSAPLFYDGKVYAGVAGGEYGIRGRIMAYDAEIGREIWRFNTIPGPGEKDHDSWPADNKAWMTGGAPVWQTPSVDPELGYLYFATGNTAPDLDGSNREGENLYADSILALDASTGEYKWHFQEVHHDIWDMDPANPTILYDVEMDGKMRKGIAQAGKTGWVYFLDRETGEPLVGIEEKAVPQDERQKTAATQPFPVGDAFVPQRITQEDLDRDFPGGLDMEFGGIFDPFWEDPLVLKPGPGGGANWPPSAYNPDTEYMYVLAQDGYFSFTRSDEEFVEGDIYIGSLLQSVKDAPLRGSVTAIDVKTNKIAWQHDWDSTAYSGVLTTKGNLVFVGHNDGRLIAFNAKTGEEVWEYKMDAGANAPSVTYEVDGVQYISILAAGNSLAGSKHGDKVYTFKLNGELKEAPVADSNEDKPKEEKPEQPALADTEKGLALYRQSCIACHGDQGVNGHNGPNLQTSPMRHDKDKIIAQINEGSGAMPPFKNLLSTEEVEALTSYITTVIAPLGDE
ncbi:PQQ-binding-like beta-propeller repeat protein [Sporosarcina sp. FSL K6-2383]|uniref:outer membrane protein assembly factor BamB family protein n=1 Tax=Sporosarcina sp. FSL K6-2383 TaxID=2921556 RepID=UPI00315ACFA0